MSGDPVRQLVVRIHPLDGVRQRPAAVAKRPAVEHQWTAADRAFEPSQLIGLESDPLPVARDRELDQPGVARTRRAQQETERP
jgi:hypothetical protein